MQVRILPITTHKIKMCMQSKLKLAIKEAYYRGYRVNEECMLITPLTTV